MDKCPFCGADILYDSPKQKKIGVMKQYFCETRLFSDGEWIISEKCCKRQNLAKDQQIASLQERLEAWREYANYLIVIRHSHESNESGLAYEKLKDLGEI